MFAKKFLENVDLNVEEEENIFFEQAEDEYNNYYEDEGEEDLNPVGD